MSATKRGKTSAGYSRHLKLSERRRSRTSSKFGLDSVNALLPSIQESGENIPTDGPTQSRRSIDDQSLGDQIVERLLPLGKCCHDETDSENQRRDPFREVTASGS